MSYDFNPPPGLMIIPVPTEIGYGYGIYSTIGPYSTTMQTRATTIEKEAVCRAAELLGISMSNFMRRAQFDAAKWVLTKFGEETKFEFPEPDKVEEG